MISVFTSFLARLVSVQRNSMLWLINYRASPLPLGGVVNGNRPNTVTIEHITASTMRAGED